MTQVITVPRRKPKKLSLTEIYNQIYLDAEFLMMKMRPDEDPRSRHFQEEVFDLAMGTMIDAFVKYRGERPWKKS